MCTYHLPPCTLKKAQEARVPANCDQLGHGEGWFNRYLPPVHLLPNCPTCAWCPTSGLVPKKRPGAQPCTPAPCLSHELPGPSTLMTYRYWLTSVGNPPLSIAHLPPICKAASKVAGGDQRPGRIVHGHELLCDLQCQPCVCDLQCQPCVCDLQCQPCPSGNNPSQCRSPNDLYKNRSISQIAGRLSSSVISQNCWEVFFLCERKATKICCMDNLLHDFT